MLARAVTHALVGLEPRRVEVEAHLQNGVPSFALVGLGVAIDYALLMIMRFRAELREGNDVETALAEHEGVLALGGGSVLDEHTRGLLHGLPVVFLDVGIKAAASRIGLNRDRPLLIGNPRAQWIRLMEARRHLYDEVATVTVVTDWLSPAEVADEIMAKAGRSVRAMSDTESG